MLTHDEANEKKRMKIKI